jgi:urease accessory protein
MALEAQQQGAAFVAVTRAAWPGTALDRMEPSAIVGAPYAVVFAIACADVAPLEACLVAFAQAFAANLVSAGVRLVPLGQTDGQKATASLSRVARCAATRAMRTPFEDIGSAAPLIDIASMRHETQYTRLFRS